MHRSGITSGRKQVVYLTLRAVRFLRPLPSVTDHYSTSQNQSLVTDENHFPHPGLNAMYYICIRENPISKLTTPTRPSFGAPKTPVSQVRASSTTSPTSHSKLNIPQPTSSSCHYCKTAQASWTQHWHRQLLCDIIHHRILKLLRDECRI